MTSRRQALTALTVLGLAWLAVLVGAPLLGGHPVSLSDLFDGDETAAIIVIHLRLPRVLLGLLAGGGLAVAGAALQTLFRNPLAEPYTLGVASSAALGAVLALQLEAFGVAAGLPVVAAAAFVGALAASAVVLGLAVSRFGSSAPSVLLAGVAISLSASALILLVQYLTDFTGTFRIVRWMMGGLAVVGYAQVLWAAPFVLLGTAALLGVRWQLNLMLTGEELAASRGVDVSRLRLLVLGGTSLMVAALVALCGPIGFVGLIVPHMLRHRLGEDHLVLLPAAALGGGVFLVLCDLGARTVLAPAEVPVGIVTALLGGPFFLWLLLSRRHTSGPGDS